MSLSVLLLLYSATLVLLVRGVRAAPAYAQTARDARQVQPLYFSPIPLPARCPELYPQEVTDAKLHAASKANLEKIRARYDAEPDSNQKQQAPAAELMCRLEEVRKHTEKSFNGAVDQAGGDCQKLKPMQILPLPLLS